MDSGIIIPEGFPFSGIELEEIISPYSVQKRVEEIGKEISELYKDKVPIIIGVLNGAFLFMADLVRHLHIQFEVDFIKIDSYGNDTKSSGTVRLLKDISADITGRDVIVVEDIVDTGNTMNHYLKDLKSRGVGDIKIASLLSKPEALQHDIHIDYLGFEIDNKFVIGYGLDYDYKGRNFPDIYQLKS